MGIIDSLCVRDQIVLALVGSGWCNREIAAFLGVSLDGLSLRVRRLRLTFGVRSRTALVRVAQSHQRCLDGLLFENLDAVYPNWGWM